MNEAEQDGPDWFRGALADRPERSLIEVEGAAIELLTWGRTGQPGLLFLHGNTAHADWWSYIAPFFAAEHRVAALSYSGMGGSAWREAYSIDLFAAEAIAAAEAAGLFEAEAKPWIVAHSFGGVVGLRSLDRIADRVGGLIIVDNGARDPAGPARPVPLGRPHRVFASRQAALDQFKLRPPQPCDNDFVLRHLAAHAIVQTSSDENPSEAGEPGWTWKFDPFVFDDIGEDPTGGSAKRIAACTTPLAFIWGEQSALLPADLRERTRASVPPGTPFVEIPQAGHHVMVDQPLAFVATLRALLETYGREHTT
jgi:pimeloyl-ACP methyl ester carboxylesterase